MTGLQTQSTENDELSIVCLGTSAGGFDAYCTILGLLPTNTGLSFIIVHHQPEKGKPLLPELLPQGYQNAGIAC